VPYRVAISSHLNCNETFRAFLSGHLAFASSSQKVEVQPKLGSAWQSMVDSVAPGFFVMRTSLHRSFDFVSHNHVQIVLQC
jgi:hypothetical protein